jgi:hypothetical protein
LSSPKTKAATTIGVLAAGGIAALIYYRRHNRAPTGNNARALSELDERIKLAKVRPDLVPELADLMRRRNPGEDVDEHGFTFWERFLIRIRAILQGTGDQLEVSTEMTLLEIQEADERRGHHDIT